jgi:O-antigen ligase/O-antigen/teichoic acid export membrane protein
MARRPLGAIVSQVIVAASSLLLSLIALRTLGAAGLGTFSLLFAILITLNSIQTGWIGDSLTVLDRFDPGIRRALFQSQWAAALLVAGAGFLLAVPIDGVDTASAVLFAVACVAWALEETGRRVLIARREFWSLVVNDVSFAAGALALVAASAALGTGVTLDTMITALIAGAVVAIGVAVVQLPRIELLRGPQAASRLREVASFAGWRSIQVGLRPATLAIVRAIVATTASLTALGQLEAARLLIAPVLTVVNGAGVYLLPTYADQVKRRLAFRPAVVRAMVLVGLLAVAYGVVAVALQGLLVDVLTDGDTEVSTIAVIAWIGFAAAFGIGVPVGSAMVALGHSRRTFLVRAIDAGLGIAVVAVLAGLGAVDLVPAGLAVGACVGAALLLRALRDEPPLVQADAPPAAPRDPEDRPAIEPVHWSWVDEPPAPPSVPSEPSAVLPSPRPSAPPAPPRPPVRRRERPAPQRAHDRTSGPAPRPTPPRRDRHADLLWIVPLLLIVFTEYKVRRRSIDEVLEGAIDPMIAAELLVYAIVGTWAVWRSIALRPRPSALMMLMWGYVLTTAVSALYSTFPMLALARAVQLVIIGLVIQLVAAEGTVVTIRRFLHGWIALLSVSIVVGLAYVAPTTGPQEGRFTWLSMHSVSAGSMLAMSVPVLLGLWFAADRRRLPWPRWIYGALFVTHLVFLLLTRTRGSIGGAFVAIAVMAWLASGRKARPGLVLGSLVAGGALALAFGRPVLEFLTRGETADQIGTFNRRTEIWSLAWASFVDHPVFGLGFNSAKGVFFDETGLGGAHNAAINVMVDVGLAGLLWWAALIAGSIVVLARSRRFERRSPVLLDGASGSARFDHLILVGLFTAMLVNSITTEGLGAGVNVSAIWLFVGAAWLTILVREEAAVPRSIRRRDLERSVRQGELRGEVRDRQREPVA